MSRSQKFIFPFLGLTAVLLLVVGAKYDLAIDAAIYSPNNFFAIFMEAVCWWPLWLSFALLGAVWSAQTDWRKIVGMILFVATPPALGYMALVHFLDRNISPALGGIICALLTIAVWVCCLSCKKANRYTRQRLSFVAGIGVLLCLAENIVIKVLKMIWQRTRFDDMVALGSFDNFSAWYAPGGSGGSSFPSGHTASACGVLILLLLPFLFVRAKRHAGLITILCYGYVAISGYARMLIGRHYLSDTVAATLVVTALFYLILCLPAVRRKLSQLKP